MGTFGSQYRACLSVVPLQGQESWGNLSTNSIPYGWRYALGRARHQLLNTTALTVARDDPVAVRSGLILKEN